MIRWQPHLSTRHETLGATGSLSRGTTITAAGSADTKGSYANVGSATKFDYHSLHVMAVSLLPGDFVFDIALSTGDLLAGDLRLTALSEGRHGGGTYALPLYVPAGSQLQVRCACSIASRTMSVVLTGSSGGWMGAPGVRRCSAIYTPTSSRGLTLTPTVANTDTAWTEMLASTSRECRAIMVAVGPGGEFPRAASHFYLVDIGLGAAGNEAEIVGDLLCGSGTAGDVPLPMVFGPFPTWIPGGNRISCRVRTDDVTSGERAIDVAAWGFF